FRVRNTVKKMKGREAAGEMPEELLLTIRGFQESRVILTGIELNVFAAIGDGATASQVAAKIGTDARATEMLLNALVAMGMLTKSSGVPRYAGNGALLRREIAGRCARCDDAYRAPLGALVDTDGMRACGNFRDPAGGCWAGRRLDGSVYCRDAPQRASACAACSGSRGRSGCAENAGRGRGIRGVFHCVCGSQRETAGGIAGLARGAADRAAAHRRGGAWRANQDAGWGPAHRPVGPGIRCDSDFRDLPHAWAAGES